VPWPWLAFAVAVALIILTGAIPREYEVADRLDFVLPAIYKVLRLREKDRIVVHRRVSFPTNAYEQLTEYYPKQTRATRGRRFPMSHGIVAKVFKGGPRRPMGLRAAAPRPHHASQASSSTTAPVKS
jgi:hypothetical protein